MNAVPPNPYTKLVPSPFANQDLLNHSKLFAKTKYVAGASGLVYIYVGWNLANITIVNCPSGLVIVDTGEDTDQLRDVWNEFKNDPNIDASIKAKPIVAVVLTHHHADHVSGTHWLVKEGLFQSTDPIWGAANLDAEYTQENGLILPIMSCRAMAQYNNLLKHKYPDEVAGLNSGIGPIISQGVAGYIKPNNIIDLVQNQIQSKTLGGLEFQFVYVPSEANSEIAAYLPSEKVLLSAEVIQDHSFPNLYTLRGASFRDPSNWYQAIDTFIALFPDAVDMVLQHGPPVLNKHDTQHTGSPIIQEILVRYRDAIQLVFDQTLRWAMKGYAKDEIMHMVRLPPQQKAFKPWLEEYYGTVKHAIPQIYSGYIGWFDGDPVALNSLPRSEFAKRLVEAMGGRKKAFEIANAAFEKGNALSATSQDQAEKEWQYAAEIATYLIREQPELVHTENPEADVSVTPPGGHAHHHPHSLLPPQIEHIKDQLKELVLGKDDEAQGRELWWMARYLKAACFRQMAYRAVCANWRGTYLTAAHELEGVSLVSEITKKLRAAALLSAANQDTANLVEMLQTRLKAEIAEGVNLVIALKYNDQQTNNLYRFEIRNCILLSTLITNSATVADATVTITGNSKSLNLLLGGDAPGGFDALLAGKYPDPNVQYTYQPSDGEATAMKFFSYFEAGNFTSSPNIYVH